MELVRDPIFGGWKVVDPSGVTLSSGDTAPATVYVLSTSSTDGVAVQRPIPVAELHHLRTVECGTREASAQHAGWTSNSRYSLYEHRSPHATRRPVLVVLVQNGGGPRFLALNHLSLGRSFGALFPTLDEVVAWDLLDMLFTVFDRAWRSSAACEGQRFREAFVDGRLVKKKQRGTSTYTVTIKSIFPPPNADGSRSMVLDLGGASPGERPWRPMPAGREVDRIAADLDPTG